MSAKAKSSSSSDEPKKAKSKLSVSVDGKDLVIRIRMQEAEESKSGKTMVIATTHGNKETDAEVDGKTLFLGLNAYYYAKDKKDRE